MIDTKKIHDAGESLAGRLGYVQVVLPGGGKAVEGLYQTPERAEQVKAGTAPPWGTEQMFHVWVNGCALRGGITQLFSERFLIFCLTCYLVVSNFCWVFPFKIG